MASSSVPSLSAFPPFPPPPPLRPPPPHIPPPPPPPPIAPDTLNGNLGSTTSSANVNSELLDSIPLSISKPCSIPESHHANSNALSNNSLNPSVINSSNTLDPVPPS